jgi:uroporphyrinogen-III synthase
MQFSSTSASPRVLVTRPLAQANTWVKDLTAQGVDAVALPLIDIVPLANEPHVTAAWEGLADDNLVMFVSPNAAEHFFAPASRGVWPQHVLAASPGPGTSASLRAFGVPPECIIEPAFDAPQFDSEALWQQLQLHDWRQARVLVVAGEGGRDWLAQQFKQAGARVDHLLVYRRGPPQWTSHLLGLAEQALSSPGDHLWFFSSSEAVRQLLRRFPSPCWGQSRALATHPRIAQAAIDAGFSQVTTSRANFEAVLACIQSLGNSAASSHQSITPPTRSQ